MNILIHCSLYPSLTENNFLLKNKNSNIGDNMLLPYNELYVYAKSKCINIYSPDTIGSNKIDAYLFLDFPLTNDHYFESAKKNKIPMYLIVVENGLIHKDNFDKQKHVCFKRIFTYFDEHVDNKKYIKLNYSFQFPKSITGNFNKRKLCTLIAGNKKLKHPLELYSERINAIRWFEKNHPDEFDLYGMFWKYDGKFSFFLKYFFPFYPSYKGRILRKRDILTKYKFCICYENVRDVPGYITEKIFDCLFSGCIPIYWGPNNLSKYIPTGCYIDRKEFKTYEEIYSYLKSITSKKYEHYLNNIDKYLKSKQAQQFTTNYFSRTIIDTILLDIQN